MFVCIYSIYSIYNTYIISPSCVQRARVTELGGYTHTHTHTHTHIVLIARERVGTKETKEGLCFVCVSCVNSFMSRYRDLWGSNIYGVPIWGRFTRMLDTNDKAFLDLSCVCFM